MAFSELRGKKFREQLGNYTSYGDVFALFMFEYDPDEAWNSLLATGAINDDNHEVWHSIVHHPTISELEDKAVNLFWKLYEQSSSLPDEYERLVLEYLDYLYEHYRVVYQPDDETGNLIELITHTHISCALAFRIKQNHGLSEQAMECLTEVERTVKRIQARCGGLGHDRFWLDPDDPASFISTYAVAALAYVELSRESAINGKYTDSLHYLARAICYYGGAVDSVTRDPIRRSLEEDRLKAELQLRRVLKPLLTTGLQVSLEEASSIFESIRGNPGAIHDWGQVVEDCQELKFAWYVSGCDEKIQDERATHPHENEVTWREFWNDAQGWASAQLSPSEYRKMREDDEKRAAETRLKNYFFGDNWSSLPERARERLVNADLIWNSPQRVSRESVLNALLRATEEMCYSYIARPLRNTKEATSLSVRDYIRICEEPRFKNFLEERQLAEDEVGFLTEEFPATVRQLTEGRNSAEHETGTSTSPALVDSAYRLFLGIGRPGILPQLARIGRKLQSHHP